MQQCNRTESSFKHPPQMQMRFDISIFDICALRWQTFCCFFGLKLLRLGILLRGAIT